MIFNVGQVLVKVRRSTRFFTWILQVVFVLVVLDSLDGVCCLESVESGLYSLEIDCKHFGWLTGWWLEDRERNGKTAWLRGRQTSWPTNQLTDDWLTDRLTDWLISSQMDWLTGWLTDRLSDWWLADSLIDRLINKSFTDLHVLIYSLIVTIHLSCSFG